MRNRVGNEDFQERLILFSLLLVLLGACGRSPDDGVFGAKPHGAWVSAGGELLKDSQNPWWVKNTSRVKYCIQIDTATVSASESRIETLFERALAYWKTEFGRRSRMLDAFATFEDFNSIGAATQQFERVPCSGTEDLRLQFGYGTLTPEQIAYLRTPRHYVGVTVRTEYDEVELRGRGFIFMASDSGAHRYDGTEEMIEMPWKHDQILYFALVHELGHVFGIPHSGKNFTLMAADFPQILMYKGWEPFLSQLDFSAIDFFFVPKKDFSKCSDSVPSTELYRFLELADSYNCLHFRMDEDKREIAVTAEKKQSRSEISVGTMDSLELSAENNPELVLVKLNPLQRVFSAATVIGSPWQSLAGPYFLSANGTARLKLPSGKQTSAFLRIGPHQLELVGSLDGREMKLLSWLF